MPVSGFNSETRLGSSRAPRPAPSDSCTAKAGPAMTSAMSVHAIVSFIPRLLRLLPAASPFSITRRAIGGSVSKKNTGRDTGRYPSPFYKRRASGGRGAAQKRRRRPKRTLRASPVLKPGLWKLDTVKPLKSSSAIGSDTPKLRRLSRLKEVNAQKKFQRGNNLSVVADAAAAVCRNFGRTIRLSRVDLRPSPILLNLVPWLVAVARDSGRGAGRCEAAAARILKQRLTSRPKGSECGSP